MEGRKEERNCLATADQVFVSRIEFLENDVKLCFLFICTEEIYAHGYLGGKQQGWILHEGIKRGLSKGRALFKDRAM